MIFRLLSSPTKSVSRCLLTIVSLTFVALMAQPSFANEGLCCGLEPGQPTDKKAKMYKAGKRIIARNQDTQASRQAAKKFGKLNWDRARVVSKGKRTVAIVVPTAKANRYLIQSTGKRGRPLVLELVRVGKTKRKMVVYTTSGQRLLTLGLPGASKGPSLDDYMSCVSFCAQLEGEAQIQCIKGCSKISSEYSAG